MEEWLPIPNYTGYLISKSGFVKSIKRNPHRILAIRTECKTKYVRLCLQGKDTNFQLWTLVALTFLPNPNNYEHVMFKDGNSLNVTAYNMAWAQNPYTQEDEHKWEVIKGYPMYEICEIGIRNVKSRKLLKVEPRRGAYATTGLLNDDKRQITIPVHELMAKQFVPNPNNLPLIKFIDGDKDNFHPNNLVWVDHDEKSTKSRYSNEELNLMDWREITGYPGYLISSVGIIVSNKRNNPMVMEETFRHGKKRISLMGANGGKSEQIAKLLATAFLPNPKAYRYILYIDKNPLNVCLDNVRWAENPYNIEAEYQWDNLKDFPKYEIGPIGIRNIITRKILKPLTAGYDNNYPHVVLTVDKSSSIGTAIHILMARHYIPNPENKPYVNHKDGNKNNFHFSNLEWVTPKENAQHAKKMGLIPDRTGKGGRPIEELDLSGTIINEFSSLKNAAFAVGCSTTTLLDYFKKKLRVDKTIVYNDYIYNDRILRYKVYNDLDGEIWKQVNTEYPETNARYDVSNMGRVRNRKTDQVLEQSFSGPYKIVGLSTLNGISNQHRVHRLVAFTFLPFTDRSHQVNHIDKNESNNLLINLEILPVAEHNMKDHGKPIFGITRDNRTYVIYPSLVDAGKSLGIVPHGINTAMTRNGTAGGYLWYYLDDTRVQDFISRNKIPLIYNT